MSWDPNRAADRAQEMCASGRPEDAIKLYLYLADGDPSLDGGYLGKKLGECYEKLRDYHAAYYWYGRAVEENPDVRKDCLAARARIASMSSVDYLMRPE